VAVLFLLVAVTVCVSAQDLILNAATTVNNGTINVNRNVQNNSGGAAAVTGTGRVQFTGTGGSNTHSVQGDGGVTFERLDFRGDRIASLSVPTTVNVRLGIGFSAAYTAGTTGFSIGAQTLTLGGTSSYLNGSSAALTFSGGTVAYTSGSAQNILNIAAGVTYGTLNLSGAGAKTLPTGGTVAAAALTQAGGQLVVNENLNLTGTATIADLGSIAAAKMVDVTGTATAASVTSMNNASTGTFRVSPNINVTIGTLAGNSGTINNAGTGTMSFTNNITNGSTITTGTGKIDLNGSGQQTNTGGTISVTGAGELLINGDLATTPGTLTLAATSTTRYDGAAQNLATGATYGNLSAEGTGAKTGAANLTVAGNLAMSQNILQTGGALTMTSTTASNVSGTGEVRGAVRRAHDFAAATNYLFNRSDVYLTTAVQAGTDLTVNMSVATDPSGTLPNTKYVQRKYAITPTTAGNLTGMQLHYEAGELQGSPTEAKLGVRGYTGANWLKINNVGQTRTSGSNVVTYSGLNNSLGSYTELGIFGINFITLADASSISVAGGWDENAMPDNTDDVVVNHTGVYTDNVNVSVGTLTINAGKDLSTTGSGGFGDLTVATTSTINGTLSVTNRNASIAAATIGTGGSVSVSSGRTLTGTTLTNNSSSASTFTGNASLTNLVNSGTGALNFNGNGSTISTAVSNAAGATISVGGTLNMLTAGVATLNSAGNITVAGASGILNVGVSGTASNLTMANGSTLTIDDAAGQLNVFGNLELGATATLSNAGTITVGE
jgi:filamentous hemagglutinin